MRRPPGLAARTVAVTFITVAVILSIVFIVLVVDARDRVRAAETDKLEISSRVFTAFEERRDTGSTRDDGDAGRDPHAQGRARHLQHRGPTRHRATTGALELRSRPSRASSRSWRR